MSFLEKMAPIRPKPLSPNPMPILANNFGNLAQRSLSMITKNCDGKVPDAGTANRHRDSSSSNRSRNLFQPTYNQPVTDGLLKLDVALDKIRERLSATNQYFADQAPWALRKTDPERADTVLYYTAESIRQLAIMLRWVMPESCDRMLDLLAQPEDVHAISLALNQFIKSGIELPQPKGIFPRLELPEGA